MSFRATTGVHREPESPNNDPAAFAAKLREVLDETDRAFRASPLTGIQALPADPMEPR